MSNNFKLFFFLIGFYFLLLLVVDIKSYILAFIFAAAVIFFYFKFSLIHTVFLILVISLPFENNLREWFYQVTVPLYSGVLTSGYIYFFGISLKLIFSLFLFLLLIKQKNIPGVLFKKDWPLLLFFGIALLNTLFNFSTLSILGLLRLWLSILIYFAAKIFFHSIPKLFPIIISAIFIFSAIIGLNQLIFQKPLGKFIELTPSFSTDQGYSTTDGQSLYRVSGFISHPVYFGSFMSILLPIFMTYTLSVNLPLTLPISFVGIIVMLGTQSRSVWLTLFLSSILLFPYLKKRYVKNLSQKGIKILLLIFTFISAFIIINRISSLTNIFSKNGNASIRLDLIKQSLIIISQHPFGVGLNQFTTRLIELPLPKSLDGFIVPVHNTILLITSELGIIAGSLFIYFVIKSIFFKKIYTTPYLITYGAIVGAITFLINSQFHPLFNLDPTFDIFMLTLGFINSQTEPSRP
jgi:hypothetical protein